MANADRCGLPPIGLLAFVMGSCTLGYWDDCRQWAGGADAAGGYRSLESL
jgi:hypothetical protein